MYRQDEEQAIAPPRDRGFTLIELLIVIAILGILSTIVVLSVRGITDRGTSAACSSDEKSLENAYEAYVAKGTPAFTTGSFETFLVTSGFLHSESTRYDVASDGSVTAQTGGGCTGGSTGGVANDITLVPTGASTFLPAGAAAPADLAALQDLGLTAPSGWSAFDYVVLGDGSLAFFDPTRGGWQADQASGSVAPAGPGALFSFVQDNPLPVTHQPVSLAVLNAAKNTVVGSYPPAPVYFFLADGTTKAQWNGTAWITIP